MEYRDKIDAFRDSCRVYLKEKETEANLKGDSDELFVRFLKEDIQFVEDTFERIKSECGSDAGTVVWKLFVDDKTQTEVAEEYGISRRQLQYSLYNWLHRIFGN